MELGRFRLTRPTLGVSLHGQEKTCVLVPANEIIEVELADTSAPTHTTTVKWGSVVLSMFTDDVLTRVVALTDPT